MHLSNLLSTKLTTTTYCCYFSRKRKENCRGRAPSIAWWYWWIFSTKCSGRHWVFCILGWEKLKQVAEKESRFLLCDNLTSQTSDDFKTAVSNLGGIVCSGILYATDLWQILLMEAVHNYWKLSLCSNIFPDKWYNGKISVKYNLAKKAKMFWYHNRIMLTKNFSWTLINWTSISILRPALSPSPLWLSLQKQPPEVFCDNRRF